MMMPPSRIPTYNDSAFPQAAGALSFYKNDISKVTFPKQNSSLPVEISYTGFVHDGINRRTRRRMNLKLSGDVSAVGNHRIDGDKEMVGYLLVGHTLNQSNDYILLTVAQLLVALQTSALIILEILALTSFCFSFRSAFLTAGIKDFFLYL